MFLTVNQFVTRRKEGIRKEGRDVGRKEGSEGGGEGGKGNTALEDAKGLHPSQESEMAEKC